MVGKWRWTVPAPPSIKLVVVSPRYYTVCSRPRVRQQCTMKSLLLLFTLLLISLCIINSIDDVQGGSVVQAGHLLLLGCGVCILVMSCGFFNGRNRACIGFLEVSPFFPCHKFHSTVSPHTHLIHFVSFHFNCSCDDTSGVVGWYPCYSQTFSIGASLHFIPGSEPVSDWFEDIYLFNDVNSV